jgi:predicted dehydrogenase
MPIATKKFNVGVIGYGQAAQTHIAAINATGLAQVTAIHSARQLNPAELSARHGGTINCYSDVSALLADSTIQVVDICSYPKEHAVQAIAAAKAGKHLIIEKPIALSWEDCLEVQKAVQAAKVQACVCFEHRFSSQMRTIKAIIDRGLLGRIHYGEVDYYRGIGPGWPQFRWAVAKEQGGSSLLAAGCHALDALLLCMGENVEVVSSYSTHSVNKEFARYEYPTTSVTILKFKDGRVGKVASVMDCLQPFYFRIHLIGSEGSLLDDKLYSTQLGGLDVSRWSQLAIPRIDSASSPLQAYQAQFEAFFTALNENREMPLTSLSQALLTHEVIFAADSSAERHAHRRHGH